MPEWFQSAALWQAVGIVAACIFYGRFYLQWLVSERAGRSVVPIGFWYMSSAGSLLLLTYAVASGSPVGALSHCFNIVIYTRNLVHIWNERQLLTPTRSRLIQGAAALVVLFACSLAAITWMHEYGASKTAPPQEVFRSWLWIGVGVAAQGLFACRFLVQWLATEREQKSVIPVAFWYISLAAAALLMTSHLQQHEWIFGAGVASTFLIYARNLWLIRRGRKEPDTNS